MEHISVKLFSGERVSLEVGADETWASIKDKISKEYGIEPDNQDWSCQDMLSSMLPSGSDSEDDTVEKPTSVEDVLLPIFQIGGARRGAKRARDDEDGKEDFMCNLKGKLKAFEDKVNEKDVKHRPACIVEFKRSISNIKEGMEQRDKTYFFTNKLTTLSDAELEMLLSYRGGAGGSSTSKDTGTIMNRIGRVLFKADVRDFKIVEEQMASARATIPDATLLILTGEMSDDSGNLVWKQYSQAITDEIKRRARAGCNRPHADHDHDGDVSMADGFDDDHGEEGGDGGGGGDGGVIAKRGRPRKDATKSVTTGVKNLVVTSTL